MESIHGNISDDAAGDSIESWLRSAFAKAFPGHDFAAVRVLPATDAKFGDFQCNDALKFKKELGVGNPREIAQRVLAAGGKPDFIEKLESAGMRVIARVPAGL